MQYPLGFKFNELDSVTEEETEIDLVLVSVEDLGLNDVPDITEFDIVLALRNVRPLKMRGATLERILCCAQKLGLELCTPEMGLQLTLQCDLPVGNSISVGMEPLPTMDGCHFILHLSNMTFGYMLFARGCSLSTHINGDNLFVFVRPRKKLKA